MNEEKTLEDLQEAVKNVRQKVPGCGAEMHFDAGEPELVMEG